MSLDVGKVKLTLPGLDAKGAGAARRVAVDPQTPLDVRGLVPRLNGINGELAPEGRSEFRGLGQNLYILA